MSRKEVPRAGLVKAALAGRITNAQGATALRLTIRQFQRLKVRVGAEGARGVLHRGRGQPSPRRLPADARERIGVLLQTTDAGFNDWHLTDKLHEAADATLHVSRATVRRLRRALGLPSTRRRRRSTARHHRVPEAAMGALIQVDASPFAWLEDRGPTLALVGAVDDATRSIRGLTFRPTEDLHGYAVVLEQIFARYGLPLAVYGDGINILVRNDAHWTLEEELAGQQAPTHLGRVLQDLGIGYIRASSPQAKGRIERLWETPRIGSSASCASAGSAPWRRPMPSCPNFSPPSIAASRGRRPAPRPSGAARRLILTSCSAADIPARSPAITPSGSGTGAPCCPGTPASPGPAIGSTCANCSAASSFPGPFTLKPRSDPSANRGAAALARLPAPRPAAALRSARPGSTHPWRRPFSRRAPSLQPVGGG